MDEAAVRGDVGQPPRGPADVDRIEALEQQVRQLTSRLAGWVEAQLVQAIDDRRNEMKAQRAELQVIVNEQLAGMRAEASSVLTVATRRLEVAQEQLAERLDTVAERAADAAARTIALNTASTVEGERLDIVEQQVAQRLALVQEQAKAELAAAGERQRAEIDALRAEMATGPAGVAGTPALAEGLELRVRSAMSRLSDSVEDRLGEVAEARRSDLDALRAELAALVEERASQAASTASSSVASTLGRRLDDVGSRMTATAEEVAALKGEAEAGPARIETFEQRVKAAMVRLTDSVETRLTETINERDAGLDALRTELVDRVEAVRREVARAGEGVAETALAVRAGGERTDVVEQQMKAALARVEESVDSRLGEQATAREAEVERLRADMAATALTLVERIDATGLRTAAVADRVSELGADAEAGPARIEAFEQRVKAAMVRLTDSVETRLTETISERDAGLDALRTELVDRVEAMQREVAEAGEGLAETTLAVRAGRERTDVVEQQTKSAVARVEESITTRLSELSTAHEAEAERLRAEAAATALTLGERIDATGRRTAAVADRVGELGLDVETAAARAEELEQRVKAAVGRLAESVEERLSEAAVAHSAQLRLELETAGTVLRTRFTQVHERVEAVERRAREAEEHLDEVLEAKVGEVVDRRRAEFDALKRELEDALAGQLRGARAEIATAVAEAHRRFVVSVDQLHERMNVVADQSAAAHAAATQIETMEETVTSDGRRIEALEVHTRRTDARLGDVVDTKLSELAGRRGAEMEGLQAQLEGAQAQLRAALDAHLAETRAEVTLALSQGRQELIDGAARHEERQAAHDQQVVQALADLDALGASVQVTLRDAEDRLGATVQAKAADLEAVAVRAAANREEIDASVASVARKVARVHDQVQKRVAAVVEQMDALAAASAKEAGTLAPLRSDLRLLKAQVAELAETMAEVRPKRTAAPAKKASAAPAKKASAAPAKKASAAPAKKAGRTTAGRTTKRVQ